MRQRTVSDTVSLLRRGLLGIAALTMLGIAGDLAVERHWTSPAQLIPWGALVLIGVSVGLLLGHPSAGRVRLAQLLTMIVVLTAVVGIWEHISGLPLLQYMGDDVSLLPLVARADEGGRTLAAARTGGLSRSRPVRLVSDPALPSGDVPGSGGAPGLVVV